MALHTLEELHSRTADQIRTLINDGYKIEPKGSISEDNLFSVKLIKLVDGVSKFEVIITTIEGEDTFTKRILIDSNTCSFKAPSRKEDIKYYKVHDYIYADSEDEAKEEYKKWLAINLGLGDIGDKDPIQSFADKLGAAISDMLRRSDNESK